MEEDILREIIKLLKTKLYEYIAVVSKREPPLSMKSVNLVFEGDVDEFDEIPAITVVSVGWNKQSDDLSFSENSNIICNYRYQINLYVEGDDKGYLEYLISRYKLAIVLLLSEYYDLEEIALGSIVDSVDNYNTVYDNDGNYKTGVRINYSVLAPMFPGDMTY